MLYAVSAFRGPGNPGYWLHDEDKIALAQHGWLRNEHLPVQAWQCIGISLPEKWCLYLSLTCFTIWATNINKPYCWILRSLAFTRNDYHTRRKFSQRFQAPVNPVHGITIHPYLQLQPDNRRTVFHHWNPITGNSSRLWNGCRNHS